LISIEGVIEDVDVVSPDLTRAIQCKLHEQAEKFTLGKIYKPVLQMLEHFGNCAPGGPEIHYRLFCHFPDKTGTEKLTLADLTTIEGSGADALKSIIARIPATTDRGAFLGRFTIEFGPRLDDLEQDVLLALEAKGFDFEDIAALVYPNAVQRIVHLATRPLPEDRTVDAAAFVHTLKELRQSTFTRWTLALKTRDQVLRRLRDDLKHSLGENSRSRFFVIGPGSNAEFDAGVPGSSGSSSKDTVASISTTIRRSSCSPTGRKSERLLCSYMTRASRAQPATLAAEPSARKGFCASPCAEESRSRTSFGFGSPLATISSTFRSPGRMSSS
jgi:hypothetical protein